MILLKIQMVIAQPANSRLDKKCGLHDNSYWEVLL